MTTLRRLAAAVAAALIATAAWAQQQRPPEPPLFDTSAPQQLLELRAYCSMGLATAMQNYRSAVPGVSDMMFSPGCGMRAAIGARLAFTRSLGLSTAIELGFSNSSCAMSIIPPGSSSISSLYTHSHYYDLCVPVFMSWRLNIGRRMMWTIDTGAYFSQGLGGKASTEGYVMGQNSLGQTIVAHSSHKTPYYDSSQPLIHGVKRFDYGPCIGTGLLYRQRYMLNAVLQMGLPNLAQNHGGIDVKYHHLSLMFQFGYVF